MLKVYGYGDDNLVIDGADYPYDEMDCFDTKLKVWFTDGTIIECGYGKDHKGIWWINILEEGSAEYKLTVCDDEDADIYSDILEIDSEVDKVCRSCDRESVADLRKLFIKLKKEYPLEDIESAYREIFD